MLLNTQEVISLEFILIRNGTRFLFEYVKYYLFRPGGNCTVPQNNEQPSKFPISA